jgi:hypothetical protein
MRGTLLGESNPPAALGRRTMRCRPDNTLMNNPTQTRLTIRSMKPLITTIRCETAQRKPSFTPLAEILCVDVGGLRRLYTYTPIHRFENPTVSRFS